MHFQILTLPSLPANLALDESLLLDAEANSNEFLRIWEWPTPAVVLGAGSILADDVNEIACQNDGIPILRRSSGGGTVLLGKGCLLFSLVLAYERDPALADVTKSYRYILDRISQAFADMLPGCVKEGSSDLAWKGLKFSGNAQQRKRRHVLHHGTLLYDFDLSLIGRYLKAPERQPAYRMGRDHADFLMNLPMGAAEIKARLRAAWGATDERTEWNEAAVANLVEEKYGREEWTRRR